MKIIRLTAVCALLCASSAFVLNAQVNPMPEAGFQTIFDGKSLSGWDCDPDFWKVENGVMVATTTPEHMPKQNTFCVYKAARPADFHLKLQYKLTGDGGNSGVQYRSVEMPEVAKWVLKGYQADIDAAQQYTGQLYEERNRGFLSLRGQISTISDFGKPGSVASTGDGAQLKSFIKNDDFNEIEVIASGNTLIHIINGHVMSVFVDNDKANRRADGLIGLQLHVTKAGEKVEIKNVRIKLL